MFRDPEARPGKLRQLSVFASWSPPIEKPEKLEQTGYKCHLGRKDTRLVLLMWNPSNFPVQNRILS